jgi:hypothetical protein
LDEDEALVVAIMMARSDDEDEGTSTRRDHGLMAKMREFRDSFRDNIIFS